MNEYRIRITRQARDHLREIRKYIECELLAPVAAKIFLSARLSSPPNCCFSAKTKKSGNPCRIFRFLLSLSFGFFGFCPLTYARSCQMKIEIPLSWLYNWITFVFFRKTAQESADPEKGLPHSGSMSDMCT